MPALIIAALVLDVIGVLLLFAGAVSRISELCLVALFLFAAAFVLCIVSLAQSLGGS